MSTFKEDFAKIYQTERGVFLLMLLNLALAVVLILFSLFHLDPNSAVVKVGYGDIGGYRDGSWMDMLAFPLFGVIFGVFHNLLALRIFHKRGSGMVKLFLIFTSVLIIGAFLVLVRLLGEG